jgi:two-component system, NarL family, sensor histidine kinase LiaS
MRKLWFQLALMYASLAVFTFSILIVIIYGYNDYKDYHQTLTLNNVQAQVLREKITVAQAILESGSLEWKKRALSNIHDRLVNLERENDKVEIYRITNSSLPEVYTRILDRNGNLLASDPIHFSPYIDNIFLSKQNAATTQIYTTWLAREGGPIWIETPIADEHNTILGKLQLLYVAKYDLRVQIGNIINFLAAAFDWMTICSVPIGVACGLVGSRYVTKQLRKMNRTTESWRQGNFTPRIALPSDDVLLRHSRHLNDMADDLEMYFNLRQNLAVSDERNRVARELHDTVKQKLFALGLQLATAKAQPSAMQAAGEHILEAETIAREAQHDLMEIITQLRPTKEGRNSLFERINTLAGDFRRRFDVDIDLKHFEKIECSVQTEHNIFRITQESLMNAVRHGKASAIVILCRLDRDEARLTIADNGNGFDPSQKTSGFGLESMRERARDLPGGAFTINSRDGAGTEVKLSWTVER